MSPTPVDTDHRSLRVNIMPHASVVRFGITVKRVNARAETLTQNCSAWNKLP